MLCFSPSFTGDEKEIIKRGIKIIALILTAIIAMGMKHDALHEMELFICHFNNVLRSHCISAIEQRRDQYSSRRAKE